MTAINDLNDRISNPRPSDIVIAVYHNGKNVLMRFDSLPEEYEWEDATEIADTMPRYIATWERLEEEK